MFIKKSQGGYSRHGEQFARGSFLILFSHNQYKWEAENNTPHTTKGQWFAVFTGDGFDIQKACDCDPAHYSSLKSCPVHCGEYRCMSAGLSKVLYACMRHVSLRQYGHWMMGTARIAGQSVTVSGAYGGDGLPRDFEYLTIAGRAMLTRVPDDIAAVYWAGDGWNSSGNEAPAMRQWALATFKK